MYISNVDSLFYSIDIQKFEENNRELLNFLEFKKMEAKIDSSTPLFVDYKTYRFQILPNGLRFHSYILHNEIMSISISAHRSTNKNNYPVAVRLKSLFLWQSGYIDAYVKSIEILQDIFKGDFISEKISRADICCHIDNLDIQLSDADSFRGTFKKHELFMTNRKLTGLTFGTFTEKNCMARIYNKSLEIKASGKTWFNEIWENNSMNPETVWNVEFQVGRTFFKDYNIESVQDFLLKARSIWEKLTTDFCCYINNDDVNISRCSVRQVWQELQQSHSGYVKQDIIKRPKQMKCQADELLPLLTGVLISYGACKFNFTLDDVLADFQSDLRHYLKDKKNGIDISQLLYDRSRFIFS